MDKQVALEDIEERRRSVGIDDVELREAIRGLRVGDHVRLTLLASPKASAGETLLVRITRIRSPRFWGELAEKPASPSFADLPLGSRVAFTTSHIHSLSEGGHARAY